MSSILVIGGNSDIGYATAKVKIDCIPKNIRNLIKVSKNVVLW